MDLEMYQESIHMLVEVNAANIFHMKNIIIKLVRQNLNTSLDIIIIKRFIKTLKRYVLYLTIF